MCLAIFLLALFLVSCAPGTPGTCLRRGTGAGGVRLVSLAEGTSALAPTRFGVHCMHALTWTDTSSLWHRVHHHHHRPSVAILAQGSDIAEAISGAWVLLREPLCSSGTLHCVSTASLVLTPTLSGASRWSLESGVRCYHTLCMGLSSNFAVNSVLVPRLWIVTGVGHSLQQSVGVVSSFFVSHGSGHCVSMSTLMPSSPWFQGGLVCDVAHVSWCAFGALWRDCEAR